MDVSQIEEIRQRLSESPMKDSITAWFSSENKGCDIHIYNSITRVLNSNDLIAVIEDDIALSAKAITELLTQAEKIAKIDALSPIVTMSGVSRKSPLFMNRWRKSDYFSAWGFALNSKFWLLHAECVKIQNSNEIERKLVASPTWQKLSKRKKDIWMERITRPNYDYGIQRTIFFEKLNTIAPIFRISDNVGHGVEGAAHTRFKTPRFLRVPVRGKNDHFHTNNVKSRMLTAILKWADSQTWAGDGLLSVRGRTRGVRTTLKELFNK
jgi:hypothetical protein